MDGFPNFDDVEALSQPTGSDITEDGVALAFVERHADQLRYCHHSQHWFVWTGTHWRREESRLAFAWARQICRDASRNSNKAKAKTSKAAFAAAVERFAQSDRAFAVTAETWDQDPWLLGTPGGTVNLRSGKMREAQLGEHITKQTATAPVKQATPHPVWSAFLDQATGADKDFQAFLQRLAGYCLTGDVTEEMLTFLYGEGGTGKGTFIGTIVAIMGDYAVSVPIEVFTAGTRLNLEYYRAQMAGARLVTASETEVGATWAEAQIKEMTGNEAPLSGRHPYGKPFTFRPQFKITLVGNHAPRLKGRSTAMERRMRIAPFKHKPNTPDHSLKEKLRAEYPAILRWMIDGCLAWQNDRLGTCAAVAAGTGTYFEQQDHFGRWIEERCVIDKTLAIKPGLLQTDYNAWAKANGENQLGNNDFAEMIDRMPGLSRAKTNGVRLIKGIGLVPLEGYQRDDRDD
jgi:putative DNA primase/helicase